MEVSLIVTTLVATIGPEPEPVCKLNVAISVPSVKLSAVIVLEKEALPLTREADPVNTLSLKSAVVIPVPLVVQYTVLSATPVVVIVNVTVSPSFLVTNGHSQPYRRP